MIAAFSILRHKRGAGAVLPIGLALCMVLACISLGCNEEPPTPRQVTKKVIVPPKQAPTPAEPKAAEPESKPEETPPAESTPAGPEIPEFLPLSDRDPFKSFVTTRTAVAATTSKTPKIKTPLERYSLDQLKVVGVIAGGPMRKALLEDDVGKGYVVSPGDAVGREGGRITSIQKDRIIIESTYRDVLGNQKVRRITKKLYVSEEGENP